MFLSLLTSIIHYAVYPAMLYTLDVNIYLDISGVLIDSRGKAAAYADDFIRTVVTRWPDSTYWLTSYCWRGEDKTAQVLKPALLRKTWPYLTKIKPGKWEHLKTDAIDFKKPFLWFDDNLSPEEQEILKHYDALECHRLIDLGRDPIQLLDEIVYLKSLAT